MMKQKKKAFGFCAVFVALAILSMQFACLGTVFGAESYEWGDNLVDAGTVTLTDYNAKYLNVTLDGNATYELTCDMKINSLSTTNMAVILRENGSEGVYLDFWYAFGQVRLGEDINGLGFDAASTPNDTLYSSTFKQDQTYSLRVVMEPEKVMYWIDGTLVQVTLSKAAGSYGTRDYTTVKKVNNGKIGFIGQNSKPNMTISNITLKKDANSGGSGEEPGGGEQPGTDENEHVWVNPVAMDDATLTDYDVRWINKVMEKDTAYKLDFDLVFNDISTTRLGVILKENSSTGYYLVIWPDSGLHQIRIGTAKDGNGWPSLADGTLINQKIIFEKDKKYSFSIVMEPEKVYLYVDGQLLKVTLGNDGGFADRDYTTVARMEGAKAGFVAQHQKPNVSISNVKLYEDQNGAQGPAIDEKKVQQTIDAINAIGTVDENSESAITSARALYDSLNDDEKALVTNADTLTEAETTFRQLTSSQDLRLYGLDATYAMGYNYWGSAIRVSNAPGGGMHVEYNNGGTNVRQGVNRAVALDGLHAVFSGFTATSAVKSLAFYFADLDQQESYSQINQDLDRTPLAIVLDAAAGAIKLGYLSDHITDEVIAVNDAWQYDNIKDIEWDMRMKANDDGSYTLTVNGADATITKEQMERCNILTDPNNAYLTVCAWDMSGSVSASFDLLSLHDGTQTCADDLSQEEVAAVINLIEKIADLGTITAESEPTVKALEEEYAALNATQQGCVTNYKALSAARYRLNMLNNATEYECVKYYYITAEDVVGTNHWTSNLFITDIPGGGANFEWFNAGTNVRQLIDRECTLDGMHMVFDRLRAEDSNKKLALYIAGLYDTAADWTSLYSEWVQGQSTIMALIFDFSTGTLTAHVENQPDAVILRDDRLTYEFLKDVRWDMKVNRRADGDYDVTVAGVTGILPKSLVDSANRIQSPDSVYVTMSEWGVGYSLSVDVLAIHGGNVVCADDLTEEQKQTLGNVINSINDIYNANWQIVPEARKKLDTAWDLYEALPKEMMDLVANIKDLEIADKVMQVVELIDRLGTITLASEEAIADAINAYKELSPAYRLIVGNYKALNDAINQLYAIRRQYIITGTLPEGATDVNSIEDSTVATGAPSAEDALSPKTGETVSGGCQAVLILSLFAVVLIGNRRRKEERNGETS